MINNNIISAYEKSGAEVIVMGRGIGFKKKQGEIKVDIGLVASAALCAFICGVTEPFEFGFMFLTPGLYVIYALLYGIFTVVTVLLGFRAGFSFSAGATDLLFSASLPAAQKTWLIIPLGIAAFIVFYVVFRFAILKFDLKTPGREDDDTDETTVKLANDNFTEVAKIILEGVGGKGNVASIDNCITRLRLEIKDYTAVDEKKIKSAGVAGVIRPGKNSVQVVIGTKVQFVADEFKKLCEYAYEWNQAGYVLEDATTTQETHLTYMQNNRTAGFFIKGEEGQAEQITTGTGVEVECIKILKPYIKTTDVNSIGFAISPTSEHPEAAMKFLNEMYTNPDVVNLLDWGIEGVHYEKQDDGTIDFPEGVDANTTTYGLNMDWFFGNQFLSYIWGKGRDTTIYSRLEENNKNSEFSPVMGFSFDSTAVSSEVAAITNVINQYLPGLSCGSLNPDTEMDAFLEALDDAGMQTVIEEKQKQLDAWKAENQQ